MQFPILSLTSPVFQLTRLASRRESCSGWNKGTESVPGKWLGNMQISPGFLRSFRAFGKLSRAHLLSLLPSISNVSIIFCPKPALSCLEPALSKQNAIVHYGPWQIWWHHLPSALQVCILLVPMFLMRKKCSVPPTETHMSAAEAYLQRCSSHCTTGADEIGQQQSVREQ